MNICIFDTETIGLDKPFCYNIGYVIVNAENFEILHRDNFIVEQIWHNLPLFNTAYYANKKPIYIAEMRAHRATMNKFGYICQHMIRDFSNYEISTAYAYNSPFDERVFNYNCDWYKCNNPFDNIEILDIRGYAHQYITDNKYKEFCEKYSLFTDNGNYSTTAENVYRYITNNIEFNEEHTALEDSIIESEILHYAISKGAIINTEYAVLRSLTRNISHNLIVKNKTDILFEIECNKAKFDSASYTLKIE